MTKEQIKKICEEIIEDINLLQTSNARVVVDAIGFIHLCHFKNILQEYIDTDTFPDDIVYPSYDLSALNGHPFISIDFKHLHKEKCNERIELSEEVQQAILASNA